MFYLPGTLENYLSSLMGRKTWYFLLSYIVMLWSWASSLLSALVSLDVMGTMLQNSFLTLCLGNMISSVQLPQPLQPAVGRDGLQAHECLQGPIATGEYLSFDCEGESVLSTRCSPIYGPPECVIMVTSGSQEGPWLTGGFWMGPKSLPSAQEDTIHTHEPWR